MRILTVLIAAGMLAAPSEAAPKGAVKAFIKTLGEHVSLGAGAYFAGACAGAAGSGQKPCTNWHAGLTVAGGVALAKELTDLHDGTDKLIHDCPEHCVVVHVAEIVGGAGVGAAIKH